MIILFIHFLWKWYTWIRRAGVLSGNWNRVTTFVRLSFQPLVSSILGPPKVKHTFLFVFVCVFIIILKYCNRIYIGKHLWRLYITENSNVVNKTSENPAFEWIIDTERTLETEDLVQWPCCCQFFIHTTSLSLCANSPTKSQYFFARLK